MGSIGPLEIGLLILLALMLFGAKRLPEIGGGLGHGMREFKDSVSGLTEHHTSPAAVETPVLIVSESVDLPPEVSHLHDREVA